MYMMMPQPTSAVSCTTAKPESREWQAVFRRTNLPSSSCPRCSPPVLYQNVPQMISGCGRECQWSVVKTVNAMIIYPEDRQEAVPTDVRV
jgi:hypothetical protein